jgi:hypothetical protein
MDDAMKLIVIILTILFALIKASNKSNVKKEPMKPTFSNSPNNKSQQKMYHAEQQYKQKQVQQQQQVQKQQQTYQGHMAPGHEVNYNESLKQVAKEYEEQMQEKQMQERRMHEAQMHDKQMHEAQMHEKHMNEKQMYEKQIHEQQMREKQMHDKQMHEKPIHETPAPKVPKHEHLHPKKEPEHNSILMQEIEDLMVKGYDGKLTFARDFVAEGIDMLNRIQVNSEVSK